jgi:hypothetical protein
MQITKVLFSFFIIIPLIVLSLFCVGPTALFCEGIDTLPVAALFDNLHLTDNFASAISSLKGLAGIYAIRCVVTGALYIGSSINLSKRMNEHFFNSSNAHLRNAILKYGIGAFVFIVVEYVEIISGVSPASTKALLLAREQFYLNWLFSLPAPLRFNFLPTAGSSLGSTLLDSTKAKIGASKLGNQYAVGSAGCPGNQYASKWVSVFDLNGELVAEFPSITLATKWLGVSNSAISMAIKRGSIIKGMYRVVCGS